MQNRNEIAKRETQVSSALLRLEAIVAKHEAVLNDLSARLEASVARPGRKEEIEHLAASKLTVVDPVVPVASCVESITSRLNVLLDGYLLNGAAGGMTCQTTRSRSRAE